VIRETSPSNKALEPFAFAMLLLVAAPCCGGSAQTLGRHAHDSDWGVL
jgi:hypothetical protein